jgi:hypothetical protein
MTLPHDISRCHPVAHDDLCRDCARWVGHPDQTWGERTPANTAVVRSVSCQYIPIFKTP